MSARWGCLELRQPLGPYARPGPRRPPTSHNRSSNPMAASVPFLLAGTRARRADRATSRAAPLARLTPSSLERAEQTALFVFAEPSPKAPKPREPSACGRGGLREALARRLGEDPFGQGVAQDLGAHRVEPVVGADDARRERLQPLARLVRHVVVDQDGEGLDQRRGASRRVRVRLAGQEGHERHEAHPALARVADAAADEFHPIEGPLQSRHRGPLGCSLGRAARSRTRRAAMRRSGQFRPIATLRVALPQP